MPQVPGAQPAPAETVHCRSRLGEVTPGHAGAAHPDLALHAGRARLPRRVDDLDPRPGRPAHRAVLGRTGRRQGFTARLMGGLRHTVGRQQWHPEGALQGPLGRGIERSAGTTGEAQGRCEWRGMFVGRTVEEDLVDGGHRGEPGGPHRAHVVPERVGREAPPAGSSTQPPPASVASSAATSPCVWKSGMTATVASRGPSSYVAHSTRTAAATFPWVSGTRRAWSMVPAVDRIRASSRARPGVGVPYRPSGARVVSSVTAQGRRARPVPARARRPARPREPRARTAPPAPRTL